MYVYMYVCMYIRICMCVCVCVCVCVRARARAYACKCTRVYTSICTRACVDIPASICELVVIISQCNPKRGRRELGLVQQYFNATMVKVCVFLVKSPRAMTKPPELAVTVNKPLQGK